MAVKIRLRRMGAKKAPFDEIGYYNPLTEPVEVKINEEKANEWLSNGAQPTEVVKRLFTNAGLTK